MTPHTPGPWKIGKNGSVVTDTPDRQVEITGLNAQDTINWYGGHVICETVTNANAVLIAAAPELLEACKYWLEDGRFLVANTAEHSNAVEMLRNAIAKAESK